MMGLAVTIFGKRNYTQVVDNHTGANVINSITLPIAGGIPACNTKSCNRAPVFKMNRNRKKICEHCLHRIATKRNENVI
jgi:hypothetical protein